MAAGFVIPDNEKTAFRELAALADAEFAQVTEAADVQSARLSLTPLAKAFAKVAGRQPLRRMPRLLLSLRIAIDRQGAPLQKVARQLSKSGVEQGIIEPEQRTAFEIRLISLLSMRYLRVLAKALELGTVVSNATDDVRVVTDVRPIFLDEPESAAPIAHSVFLHTLRLQSAHDENSVIYVTMDTQTLRELKQAVERALKKEDAIRQVLPEVISPLALTEPGE